MKIIAYNNTKRSITKERQRRVWVRFRASFSKLYSVSYEDIILWELFTTPRRVLRLQMDQSTSRYAG
jgi:hypothetical protein